MEDLPSLRTFREVRREGRDRMSHVRAARKASARDLDRSAQIRRHAAADAHPLAAQLELQLAAARADLTRAQSALAEARGPEGRERAVRRARDRILGHALARREEARDEIAVAAGRAGDDREEVQR